MTLQADGCPLVLFGIPIQVSLRTSSRGDGSVSAVHRTVEPGEITVMLGFSSTGNRLTGPVRRVGHGRVLRPPARIG